MNAAFGDSFFYLALLNPDDEAHERAIAYIDTMNIRVVTTSFVLAEVADGLCERKRRASFVRLFDDLTKDRNSRIVPATDRLFRQGLALYRERLDKDWSLTDCISFAVMRDLRLSQALTGDHHFEQAGFVALLK